MKNLIFSVCMLIFICNVSNGQFELRLLAGAVNGSLTENFQQFELDEVAGYQFGADLQIGNRWYVQTGLRLESTNRDVQQIDALLDIDELKISQFRVPLYLGHRFFKRDAFFNIRMFTGPNASLVVDKNFESSFQFDEYDYSTIQAGWDAGVGIDLLFLYADVGYMFGLGETFLGIPSNNANNLFFANVGIRIKF